jgi:hypothetical protein
LIPLIFPEAKMEIKPSSGHNKISDSFHLSSGSRREGRLQSPGDRQMWRQIKHHSLLRWGERAAGLLFLAGRPNGHRAGRAPQTSTLTMVIPTKKTCSVLQPDTSFCGTLLTPTYTAIIKVGTDHSLEPAVPLAQARTQ